LEREGSRGAVKNRVAGSLSGQAKRRGKRPNSVAVEGVETRFFEQWSWSGGPNESVLALKGKGSCWSPRVEAAQRVRRLAVIRLSP